MNFFNILVIILIIILSCTEGGAGASTSGKAGGKKAGTNADFLTEYAKSGASTCRGCNEKIAKVLMHKNVALKYN